jgi:cystathionine beta-lyase/cystathionine gamma-synthase
MDISYILNELGEDRSQYFNAVSPPIVQTSNFAFNTFEELRNAFANEESAFLYSRGKNPTVDILSKKLAALDGAEDALVFNSGASAIYCSVMANVKSGDHIISIKKPYSWATRLFDNVLIRFGIETTYIDGTKIENFVNALRPETRIIYLETPNTLTYELQDLQAVSELAKSRDIITIVDNSYCTPIYQKPHDFGIDLSIQSGTKYLGGHSDVLAGVLTGEREMLKKIVEYLKKHPKIEKVIFPFDEDFPQLELAHKQMKGACGLLTVVLKTDSLELIEKFTYSLKHFLVAVSWGGHESLILPQAGGLAPEDFDVNIERHRMARIYIGFEDPDYLISDLDQALEVL